MTAPRVLMIAALLGLAPAAARGQYDDADSPDEAPTAYVPGMVLAPTALPPLGLRSPDALLLARADVQADLKLTPQQRRQLGPLQDARRAGQRRLDEEAEITAANVFSPLPGYVIADYVAEQEDFNQAVDDGVARVLTRRQRARFVQIRLQIEGPMAFADPTLVEALHLDDGQAEQVRAILADARERMVQNADFPLTTRDVPRRDGPLPPMSQAELQERLARARVANDRLLAESFARVARVLRRPQWEAYLKLRGAPFAATRPAVGPEPAAPPAADRRNGGPG